MQISLKKLCKRVEHLIQISPCDADFRTRQIIKVKMTGDGTWIGKRLHIVTFGFTVLDEGSVVKSAAGNHSVCLLKESENYESLALGLRDIREEMTDISSCWSLEVYCISLWTERSQCNIILYLV